MIRWQSHWHVVRQSWTFFQNDFAGRIASRVIQTGPAVRESLVALITGVWYILVYGDELLLVMLASAGRLAGACRSRCGSPRTWCCWCAGVRAAHARTAPSWCLEGALDADLRRIVDTYTNILTVKLFARARHEDAYGARRHRGAHRPVPITRCGSTPLFSFASRPSTPCWSPAPARSRSPCGFTARSGSVPSRWHYRCRGRSSAFPVGWRCGSRKSSRTSASCRKA